MPSQLQPGVPGSQYGESYQEPVNSPYGRGYGAPAPYQAASQPHMFLPSQAPQVPQVLFLCEGHFVSRVINLVVKR